MKDINKIKPKKPFLIKRKNQYTTNEKKQARIIANHFKKQFKKGRPQHPDLQSTPTKILFSKVEISIVINQMKSNKNKNAGRDGIKAELLEFGTKKLAK